MNFKHFSPPLYKYMNSEYIDLFINKGILRLGTFQSFKKLESKSLQDEMEGRSLVFHMNHSGEGQTITSWLNTGLHSLIYCTSMRLDRTLFEYFGYTSVLKINDVHNFYLSIAKNISGFSHGFYGPCYYLDKKIYEIDLGHIDVDNIDKRVLHDRMVSAVGENPFFLKLSRYQRENEFRFVWVTKTINENDHLDVVALEARNFCDRVDTNGTILSNHSPRNPGPPDKIIQF